MLKIIIAFKFDNNIKFIIVGDGNYLKEMEGAKKRLSLNNLILTGHLNNVISILKISNIFMLCSKHETLCNSIIEAGEIGLPVIATNIGGIPELIGDGKGILFEVGDIKFAIKALKILIENKKLRIEYGNKLKEHIRKKFNERDNIKKLQKIYEIL